MSVCLFPLLITLGFWQLDRAREKQGIIDFWESQQSLPPLTFDTTTSDVLFINTDKPKKANTSARIDNDQRFRKIKFEAIFEQNRYWLLEGKTHRGQVGYQVVIPVKLDSTGEKNEKWILVNRGWVKGSAHRSELPQLTIPKGKVIIEGNLAEPADALFVSESGKMVEQWPHQILEVNIQKMSEQFGNNFFSKIVKIDPESPHALTASWPKVNVSPEKHQAYAFQWFAMGLALFTLWLVSNTNIVTWIKRPR